MSLSDKPFHLAPPLGTSTRYFCMPSGIAENQNCAPVHLPKWRHILPCARRQMSQVVAVEEDCHQFYCMETGIFGEDTSRQLRGRWQATFARLFSQGKMVTSKLSNNKSNYWTARSGEASVTLTTIWVIGAHDELALKSRKILPELFICLSYFESCVTFPFPLPHRFTHVLLMWVALLLW